MKEQDIDIVRRFAIALDEENYEAATSTLSMNCVYLFRDKIYNGADSIIKTYQGNGEAAKSFDEIRYGSHVRAGDEGLIVIEFWDELIHQGEQHRHTCEQWVKVEQGVIVRIQHHDLQGERARLEEFKTKMGFDVESA
ncbi:MAG: hypothetical protein P1U42_08685 [Phycisphaerales bacterium]|nr:hypothetical protein [Phycisphaerales bacterium]